MRYSVEVKINKPIDKVVTLFDDPNNMYEWMEGLKSFEHLEGNPSEPGAKSLLKFQNGRRKIEMVETIIKNNLPEELTTTYEAKGVFNIVKNRFLPISNNETKYISEQEFQFKGFMKVIGFLMPGAFKKQSIKYLNDFKAFAEKQ